MRRAVSTILSTILLATIAVPAAVASIAPASLRACCMRAGNHRCSGTATAPAGMSDKLRSADCACGACERTLTSSAAQIHRPHTTGHQAPRHTFMEEFYPAPDVDHSSAVKPERAPPVAQQ